MLTTRLENRLKRPGPSRYKAASQGSSADDTSDTAATCPTINSIGSNNVGTIPPTPLPSYIGPIAQDFAKTDGPFEMYSNVSSQDPLYKSLWRHSALDTAGSSVLSMGSHQLNKDETSVSVQGESRSDAESLALPHSGKLSKRSQRYLEDVARGSVLAVYKESKEKGKHEILQWFSPAYRHVIFQMQICISLDPPRVESCRDKDGNEEFISTYCHDVYMSPVSREEMYKPLARDTWVTTAVCPVEGKDVKDPIPHASWQDVWISDTCPQRSSRFRQSQQDDSASRHQKEMVIHLHPIELRHWLLTFCFELDFLAGPYDLKRSKSDGDLFETSPPSLSAEAAENRDVRSGADTSSVQSDDKTHISITEAGSNAGRYRERSSGHRPDSQRDSLLDEAASVSSQLVDTEEPPTRDFVELLCKVIRSLFLSAKKTDDLQRVAQWFSPASAGTVFRMDIPYAAEGDEFYEILLAPVPDDDKDTPLGPDDYVAEFNLKNTPLRASIPHIGSYLVNRHEDTAVRRLQNGLMIIWETPIERDWLIDLVEEQIWTAVTVVIVVASSKGAPSFVSPFEVSDTDVVKGINRIVPKSRKKDSKQGHPDSEDLQEHSPDTVSAVTPASSTDFTDSTLTGASTFELPASSTLPPTTQAPPNTEERSMYRQYPYTLDSALGILSIDGATVPDSAYQALGYAQNPVGPISEPDKGDDVLEPVTETTTSKPLSQGMEDVLLNTIRTLYSARDRDEGLRDWMSVPSEIPLQLVLKFPAQGQPETFGYIGQGPAGDPPAYVPLPILVYQAHESSQMHEVLVKGDAVYKLSENPIVLPTRLLFSEQ
ncbi:hypothetical protein HD553DRAFT_324806 [Filobasidium floriforme]|uniref:uncharacterized protein n=1 Tax=Filobasidium floriforme TaxID=5210 RepID=UPI001E8E32D4|nr:uncharacterized protein HD553DRAFT_324806 [Filobasidium floriforme]KAH8083255.1 hypothetical protein HD553DRAFT_324806 [Filobasidium floriforme]